MVYPLCSKIDDVPARSKRVRVTVITSEADLERDVFAAFGPTLRHQESSAEGQRCLIVFGYLGTAMSLLLRP